MPTVPAPYLFNNNPGKRQRDSFVYKQTNEHRPKPMSSSSTIFSNCQSQVGSDGGGNAAVLECVSNQFENEASSAQSNSINWFFIYSAALVFIMQAGFAMLCAGSVKLKNVQNTMMKNLLDACGAALSFFSIGYAFSFGGQFESTDTTFIGSTNFFLMDIGDKLSFWLFQFAFAATAATIVAGTLAERCQMVAYLCYSILLTGFVYPVVVHSIWSNNGFLSASNIDPLWGSGMVDFAGSGVVHVTGGLTALFATLILGPRQGRFYDARGNALAKPKPFQGHSVALQMLGTFLLWFGWYGFNPGSALTLVGEGVNTGEVAAVAGAATTLGAASGCVTSLFANLIIKERIYGEAHFDLLKAMNGTLSGLVAVTASCGVVEPWAAVVIGGIGGLLYLGVSHLLIKKRIDDAVDAIPVHLANGIWGVIACGLFASPSKLQAAYLRSDHVGWFYSWGRGSADATLLACNVCGLLFIAGWVAAIMFPFFVWLNFKGWFRADSLEEMVGLDISYHGGNMLPSHQQEEVETRYMEAFNLRRENNRRRAGRRTPPASSSSDNIVDEEQYDDSKNIVEEEGDLVATNV